MIRQKALQRALDEVGMTEDDLNTLCKEYKAHGLSLFWSSSRKKHHYKWRVEKIGDSSAYTVLYYRTNNLEELRNVRHIVDMFARRTQEAERKQSTYLARRERQMATRCNVVITMDNMEPAVLYRHWDGYPSEVLPSLARAFSAGGECQNAQPSSLAAFIIADGITTSMDDLPYAEYEPTNDLHADVDYIYLVVASRNEDGDPRWAVEILEPAPGYQNKPSLDNCLLLDWGEVLSLADKCQREA